MWDIVECLQDYDKEIIFIWDDGFGSSLHFWSIGVGHDLYEDTPSSSITSFFIFF